jgi:hypothetical protein
MYYLSRGGNTMKLFKKVKQDVVWQSTLTTEMVAHLNDKQIATLVEELDDVCARLCMDYEVQ